MSILFLLVAVMEGPAIVRTAFKRGRFGERKRDIIRQEIAFSRVTLWRDREEITALGRSGIFRDHRR